jgi:hypothetical protein
MLTSYRFSGTSITSLVAVAVPTNETGTNPPPTQEGMLASDVVMLSQCDSNARATIPALEKKLADKKLPLPADERVAHQRGASGDQR